jgi:hypothetical protein
MFDINYSLKINFFIKYTAAIISIFPNIIKIINESLVKLLRSKKLILDNPYNDEFTVLVRESIDSLNESSNDKTSKVRMLVKINMEITKEIKTKKAILKS